MGNECSVKRFPCKNNWLLLSLWSPPLSFCTIVQPVPGTGIIPCSNAGPAAGGHSVNNSGNVWGGIMGTLVHWKVPGKWLLGTAQLLQRAGFTAAAHHTQHLTGISACTCCNLQALLSLSWILWDMVNPTEWKCYCHMESELSLSRTPSLWSHPDTSVLYIGQIY